MALRDILARIAGEADEKASAILSEAEGEKREQLDAFRADLEAAYASESVKLEEKAEQLRRRMVFHVEREAERGLSAERRGLLDAAIDDAVRKLSALDDQAYLRLLAKLIGSCDLEGNVEVVISARDRGRVTQQFLDGLSTASRRFLLASEPGRFEQGGVILSSGDIRVNATFGMIAGLLHEELVMALAGELEED
ncbi:hypothetical protein JW921_09430 [Candidatus Fermentibacterales bacterium]|nr:hypothetical protein [Candidatus Fermentibacterales bacterium]